MKRTFSLYTHQRKEIIKKADRLSIDTELSIKLPENSTAFLVTKFKDQEIIKINGPTKKKTVDNTLTWIAPKIITKATPDINKIEKEKIDQIVRSGGAELERVAPKIIKDATAEAYKTPFRLLGNLGRNHFQNIKRKLFK